jgi:hypothetical protein
VASVVGRDAVLVVAASCAADDTQHLLLAATLRVLSLVAISFWQICSSFKCISSRYSCTKFSTRDAAVKGRRP